MSKALSANIHDPNHTVDEYDLYFNGEKIESGSGFKFETVSLNVSESSTTSLVLNIPADVGDHYSIYSTCIGTSQHAAPAGGTGEIVSVYVNDGSGTKTGIAFTPAGNGSLTALGLSCVRSENKVTITSLAGNIFPFADFSTSFTGYIVY